MWDGEKVGDEVPVNIDLKVDFDKDKSHILYNSIMVNCVFQPFPIGAVSNLVHIHSQITHITVPKISKKNLLLFNILKLLFLHALCIFKLQIWYLQKM